MIATNDPRHGTRAGHIAGCNCPTCLEADRITRKRYRVRRHFEGPQVVDAHPTVDRIRWWLDRGVGIDALSRAGDIGEGTLKELHYGEREVCLKSTERKTLAVAWDDMPDNALCFADLTRRRMYSLAASGHQLAWINAHLTAPLTQAWRTQRFVNVAAARAVAHLSATAPAVGPSAHAATKARNRGHLPLMGWEDPGVPALPRGWRPDTSIDATPRGVDHAVVERILAGDVVKANVAERRLVVERWANSGRPLKDLERLTGWATHLYRQKQVA